MTINEITDIDKEIDCISDILTIITLMVVNKSDRIDKEIGHFCTRLRKVDNDILHKNGLLPNDRYNDRMKHFMDFIMGCGNDIDKADISVATSLLDRTIKTFLNLQSDCLGALEAELEAMTDTNRKLFISKELRRINTGIELRLIASTPWTDRLLSYLTEKQAEITPESAPIATQSEEAPGIDPIFAIVDIRSVFDILKPYFKKEDREELYKVLNNGTNAASPLIFMGQGNKFAYCFKQLYDSRHIVGCDKTTIQKWIVKNIRYMHQGNVKSFTDGYVEKVISTKDNPCKKPILINSIGISN